MNIYSIGDDVLLVKLIVYSSQSVKKNLIINIIIFNWINRKYHVFRWENNLKITLYSYSLSSFYAK